MGPCGMRNQPCNQPTLLIATCRGVVAQGYYDGWELTILPVDSYTLRRFAHGVLESSSDGDTDAAGVAVAVAVDGIGIGGHASDSLHTGSLESGSLLGVSLGLPEGSDINEWRE